MADSDEPGRLAHVEWEGDSHEVLRGFPADIRHSLGYALFQVQEGNLPSLPTRRMESVGPGVFELKESDDRTWYRVMYLARVNDIIYVLHCFEKKSRKTDPRDLRIARERLASVRRHLMEVRRAEKRRF